MFHLFKNFDWKSSKAHLLLLSKFIRGQEVKYFVERGDWEKVLNESPQKAIKRFIDEGMLINADLNALVSYKYKVGDLKNLLKQQKLAVSGTKDELVQRLIQADKEGMMKLVVGTELLTYTQAGREIAEQYDAQEIGNRNKVEEIILDYLMKGMFKEACLEVARYEVESVFPRGIGIDWNHYYPDRDIKILRNIFRDKPEILSKMGDTKLEQLRIGAAMMLLWGVDTPEKWLPDNFETDLTMDNESAARMLLFKSQNVETKKQYRDSGAVQYIEILATPESCDSCKKLEGKRYKLSEAPELPNPNCTHELGCRCVYLPCVD